MADGKNLNLSLKEIWFKQIDKGVKTIEYRAMDNDYWMKKLVVLDHPKYAKYCGDVNNIREALINGEVDLYPTDYKTATFWCNGKNMKFKIRSIKIFKNHSTFAIFLGDRLDKPQK